MLPAAVKRENEKAAGRKFDDQCSSAFDFGGEVEVFITRQQSTMHPYI
jgi:hypothetical protein